MRYFLILMLTLTSCEVKSNLNRELLGVHSVNSTSEVKSSIGVVVAIDGVSVDLYGLDSSLFKRVSFENTASFEEITPYALHLDYYLLVFDCISEDSTYYKVSIGGKIDDVALIKKTDRGIVFQTWEEHVLHCFSVGVYDDTTLRESPTHSSPYISLSRDDSYNPIEVRGDWLMVEYGNLRNRQRAWLRWRENGKLLLELFYFA